LSLVSSAEPEHCGLLESQLGNRNVAAIATLTVLIAAAANADVITSVVDIPSTSAVTQRILFIRPDAPTAIIVALPGSDGYLGITDDGAISSVSGRCFPFARTAQTLADMGIAVALVDAASDFTIYRYANVSAVVRYAQQQADVPVWVSGGSASTNPAASIVNMLPQSDRIGAVFFSTDNPSASTGAVRRPSLVIFNPSDTGQAATSFYAALTAAPVKQLVRLSGGVNTGCSYHLFQGQEAAFASSVATFIAANNDATGPLALNMNQHGITGSWYQPSTSGQGVEIEVFKDLVAPDTGFLQGSWFTYDYTVSGAGEHNRWYTFGGNVRTTDATVTLPLYQNVGGNFNALPVTSATQVGTVSLAFGDCSNAAMSYVFSDGSSRNGSIALTRLTPNVTCSAGAPAATDADFALSGNWFDASKGGQGMVVEVNPVGKLVFLAWYTYGVAGQAAGASGQRWYTAQAGYASGARSIDLALYETTGGLFDHAAPAPTTAPVGTATLSFSDCSAARLAFTFSAGSNTGQTGAINFTRVGPVPAGCSG
jgi:hypothetical protein